MYIKEKLQPNKVNAPILFIGVGGIGSKIIKGIADRAIKDDTSNIRFVVMDTDVNDLISVNKGAEVVAIQTSSTSSVGSYLENDIDAKKNWFPENEMMSSKTVSEGAGQVRAISRLALSDIIKNGKISKLYKAIDDLFLKDGASLKQAVRVVIASTAAGGTGSGIAMETGMLVRHYVKKNYPESAVMIRGFLVMPGVMDTVITSQSERDSLRCNGYATIKEINAFMMKGSGFFDTVPELHRYKDLSLSVPNSSVGGENISNLPFDFCFLMDRTDSNAGNMTTLPQYIEYASQSLYEQNIGAMRRKASSMEDNVLKLCINPDKLGRCRFGGVGASVLKYPYEYIRDYIALNWARAGIIGSSSDDTMSDDDRKRMLESSWLQYDVKFREEHKNWEENPASSSKNEPTLAGVYVSTVEAGRDPKNGNDFTMMLWDKYLKAKIDALSDEAESRNIDAVADAYIEALVEGAKQGPLENEYSFEQNNTFDKARRSAEHSAYEDRFNYISTIESIASTAKFVDVVRSFAKEVFNSKAVAGKEDLGEYMLEKFLSVRGNIMHPNAARYLLYKLLEALDRKTAEAAETTASFKDKVDLLTEGEGADDGKSNRSFEVALRRGHENGLREMCEACDKLKKLDGVVDNPGQRCNALLDKYNKMSVGYFDAVIAKEICDIARGVISNLVKCYEEFYSTFANKIPCIEKKKEDIVTKLKFKNGDCVRYVLGEKKYLEKLVSSIGRPTESGDGSAKLYGKIFESLRSNAHIEARRNVNPFYHESKMDIFDDIIVQYYKDKVESTCDLISVDSILHALKLEYEVKASIELDDVPESKKDEKAAELYKESTISKYISSVIEICNNLASPGIKKKDNDEPREVNSIACSDLVEDGNGIRINDFIPEAIRTPTVSKYELCFFRSVYNIMPVQLSKLSAPMYDETIDEFSLSDENEYEQLSAGDYFRIYQKYMDKIGPDSRVTAIITPHVDRRWNAISEMPELDMDYQKRLMRKIHKSLIYGFIYGRIKLFATSDQNPDERVYRYLNKENDVVDLVVSNGTKCDVLYEALDALYYDRLAVSIIREYVNRERIKNVESGFKTHEDLRFFKMIKELTFKRFVNDKKLNDVNDRVSLFTIVLMYCNSLPVQNKDMSEMKTMVEAIIEMIYSEMHIATASHEALLAKVAKMLVDQFNLFMENYNNHKDALRVGMFSEQSVNAIYGTVSGYLAKISFDYCIDDMTSPDNN